MKVFIAIVLFQSNENVYWIYLFLKKICAGFAGRFLSALLLLKIIASMKRWYVGVLGNIEKCINFTSVLFKVVKILKGYAVKTALVFSKTHYFEF